MTPERIRLIRRKVALSQAGLAAVLRINDVRTIRRWETGEVPISGPASILLELMETGDLPMRFYHTAKPERFTRPV